MACEMLPEPDENENEMETSKKKVFMIQMRFAAGTTYVPTEPNTKAR